MTARWCSAFRMWNTGSFVDRLLRGTWAYEEYGLLDATHLRWFTLENMRRGLLECGLALCDVHAQMFEAPKGEAFVTAIAPALQALGVDPVDLCDAGGAAAVCLAGRKSPARLMTIGASMLTPVGGVSHLRVMYPVRAIATDPAVQAHIAAPPSCPRTVPKSHASMSCTGPILTGERGLAVIQACCATAG